MTDVYQLSVIDIKPSIGHRSLMAISTGYRASTMYIYIIIHTSACRGAAPATTYARLGNRDDGQSHPLLAYSVILTGPTGNGGCNSHLTVPKRLFSIRHQLQYSAILRVAFKSYGRFYVAP